MLKNRFCAVGALALTGLMFAGADAAASLERRLRASAAGEDGAAGITQIIIAGGLIVLAVGAALFLRNQFNEAADQVSVGTSSVALKTK